MSFRIVDDNLSASEQEGGRMSYSMKMENKEETKKFPLNATNLGRLSDVLGDGKDWTNATFDANLQTVNKPGGGTVLSFRVLQNTIKPSKKQK